MGKENKETETLVINQNLYRNKDWLYNEYINKKRSAPNIAKECGIHERTLRRWIDKFGLIDIKRQAKNINKDDLFRMYRIEKMSTDDIGNYMMLMEQQFYIIFINLAFLFFQEKKFLKLTFMNVVV